MSASGVAAGERAVTAQRVLHAVLNRMKCEAEQRAKERAREAMANARHSNGFNSPSMVGINSVTVG